LCGGKASEIKGLASGRWTFVFAADGRVEISDNFCGVQSGSLR